LKIDKYLFPINYLIQGTPKKYFLKSPHKVNFTVNFTLCESGRKMFWVCLPPMTPSTVSRRPRSYAAKDRRPALLAWPKTEKTRRLSFGREDLAAVLIADRLQPAERKLVEALYARAEQTRCLATFGTAFSSHVIDGRLHGQLHAGGAITG